MLTTLDLIGRLALATMIGMLVGLNRDLHDKPAGLRTHALVALGAALVVIVSENLVHTGGNLADPVSRVIQGLVAGVGFLGAGMILRDPGDRRVHGLTTAAAVWVTALFGAACGAGAYVPVCIAFVLLCLVLVFGGPVEAFIHRRLHPPASGPPPP
jgi:putative Mg2+ transporter-C (MgtC) family protein